MDLKTFLNTVVPNGRVIVGRRVERRDHPGHYTIAHSHYTSHEEAAVAISRMTGDQLDVYYALATYKQGFHKNATTGKKQIRVRDNVESLKALWFDVDYKGAYTDAKTAMLALRAFTKTTGMPMPSLVVGSGNGMHVYWPFTEAVTQDRWQKVADALKSAAKEHGLAVDLVCTADSCRILRPPGTFNWKDPANPKPVSVLYTSGKTFDFGELEGILAPWFLTRRAALSLGPINGVNADLTGGLAPRESIQTRFDEVIKHCAVMRHTVDTHGKDAVEPEWKDTLQLLKFCEDGALWVHPVSDGHPGYRADATDLKWQQRLANSAGPALCSTFEGYRPAICAKCPHRGFVKTPVQLGIEGIVSMDGLPAKWRVAADRTGVERFVFKPAADGKVEQEWKPVLRYIPSNLRITRSIVTGRYDVSFDIELKNSKIWPVSISNGLLGNPRKLTEALADFGLVLKGQEPKEFVDLMASWLQQIQNARRVADVTEQLGWLAEGDKLVGFSTGSTTYYSDGRVRNDVRAAREFAALSRFYEPRGDIAPWKKVAQFIADQNNPAFTATLAAAFASPLLRFTGLSGGILAIVSTASGVGKSSALKASQAVWGSPTHGVNAVDDTPKSVARKLGFLNNLPAFWDELRGRKTVEDFLTLAFQITQGKEKSRLDASAQLREMATWETMLVVASNESIFDAMGRGTMGSDAGVVRTFEIFVEPFSTLHSRAEVSLLFEQLNSNYGHAGRIYAQHLATHQVEVSQRVQAVFKQLATLGHMEAQERFWFAIMASLVVGAELAESLDLIKLDRRALLGYLMQTMKRLRGRSGQTLHATDPAEVAAAFMQAHQDRGLTVDRFPALRQNTKMYTPQLLIQPRSDKLAYHVSQQEQLLRIPQAEFLRWVEFRGLPSYTILKRLKDASGVTEIRARLGIGTKWELPAQHLLQISLNVLEHVKLDGSSRPDDTLDSVPPSVPEG